MYLKGDIGLLSTWSTTWTELKLVILLKSDIQLQLSFMFSKDFQTIWSGSI